MGGVAAACRGRSTEEKLWYEYNVSNGDVREGWLSFAKLEHGMDVRDGIWVKRRKNLRRFVGIEGAYNLRLWLGENKPLASHQNVKNIFGEDEVKRVWVTPQQAADWKTPFTEVSATGFTSTGGDRTVVFEQRTWDVGQSSSGGAPVISAANYTDLKRDMQEVVNVVKHNSEVIDLLLDVQKNTWKDDMPSQTTGREEFKKFLAVAYGQAVSTTEIVQNLQCIVTGVVLYYKFVTGGHIIGVKLRNQVGMMCGLDDNNVRNGILWCYPIEVAWTVNKLCFIWAAEKNTYTMWLLDSSLAATRLADYPEGLKTSRKSKQRRYLGELTFGDLHGTDLQFSNNFRPFKRAFAMMVRLKVKWALEEGSVPLTDLKDMSLDYWSDGADTKMLACWFGGAKSLKGKEPQEEFSSDESIIFEQ